jgi:hypothetical protein
VPSSAVEVEEAEVLLLFAERVRVDAEGQLGAGVTRGGRVESTRFRERRVAGSPGASS